MSNKTATAKINLSYKSASGASVVWPEFSVGAPYQGANVATIDVPDTATEDTEFDVPFGSIESASLVLIVNRLGQDILAHINPGEDTNPTHTIAPGGSFLHAGSTVGGTPISAMKLVLTANQTEPGLLECLVFGDPIA